MLGHNFIVSLDSCTLEKLGKLQHLSLESNCIVSLAGVQKISLLTELYISNNLIDNAREIFYLKNLLNLVIIDASGNPLSSIIENYRLFVIYHLRPLKALDGLAIEPSELQLAKETFGGRLSQDFVAERLGHANFGQVRELDVPQCGIQTIDLGNGQHFCNLRSINIEHNSLTSFSGLIHLANLKVLCLNHNRIESITPKAKTQPTGRAGNKQTTAVAAVSNSELFSPLLDKLEVLHLGYNGIKDLSTLQLGRLPSLKALFLQGNEISKIEGLENLKELMELVLDRNKIKTIGEFSFISQQRLQELHIEENRLRSLTNLHCLVNLQRLYVGMNRIQELSEMDKLEPLTKLSEISLVNNAVSKRLLHRPILVYHNPNLKIIDGITVTDEEKMKAQLYFADHQQQVPSQLAVSGLDATTMLPGIGQYKAHIPVKVTNVQLLSPPHPWGLSAANSAEDTTAVHEYLRGGNRKKPGGGRSFETNSLPAQLAPPNLLSLQHGSAALGNSSMSYHHSKSNGLSGSSNKASSDSGVGSIGGNPMPQTATVQHLSSTSDAYSNERLMKNLKR
jgi:Leucine-rich repeat (LRR) protein